MPVENVDTDQYGSKEEAIAAALDGSEVGDLLHICRGDWKTCPGGRPSQCPLCAKIEVRRGMTATDVLNLAKAS